MYPETTGTMRTILSGICIVIAFSAFAQKECGHSDYLAFKKSMDPSFAQREAAIEQFIQQQAPVSSREMDEDAIIRIPVVVHILYKTENQNISDELVKSQIDALNRDFRRKNADTVK